MADPTTLDEDMITVPHQTFNRLIVLHRIERVMAIIGFAVIVGALCVSGISLVVGLDIRSVINGINGLDHSTDCRVALSAEYDLEQAQFLLSLRDPAQAQARLDRLVELAQARKAPNPCAAAAREGVR